MTTHPEGLTRPSEKSLELATRYVRMFKGDPAQHQIALNTLAILFDEARNDGLKRAAEIARKQQENDTATADQARADRKHREEVEWLLCSAMAGIIANPILMEAGEKK